MVGFGAIIGSGMLQEVREEEAKFKRRKTELKKELTDLLGEDSGAKIFRHLEVSLNKYFRMYKEYAEAEALAYPYHYYDND